MPKQRRKLLIIGCARSGTMYSSQLFRALGLDIGHEYVGEHGTASHYFAVDAAYPVFKSKSPKGRCVHVGEKRSDFEFDLVLHQVRNPLKVIDSVRWTGAPWDIVSRATGCVFPRGNKLLKAALYWWHWNKLCERLADKTIRVEDIGQHIPWICETLGIPCPETLPNISPETNHDNRYNASPWLRREGDRWLTTKELKEKIDNTPAPTYEDISEMDPWLGDAIHRLARSYGY